MSLRDVDRAVKALQHAINKREVDELKPDVGLKYALEIVTKVQEKLNGKTKRMGQRGRRKA